MLRAWCNTRYTPKCMHKYTYIINCGAGIELTGLCQQRHRHSCWMNAEYHAIAAGCGPIPRGAIVVWLKVEDFLGLALTSMKAECIVLAKRPKCSVASCFYWYLMKNGGLFTPPISCQVQYQQHLFDNVAKNFQHGHVNGKNCSLQGGKLGCRLPFLKKKNVNSSWKHSHKMQVGEPHNGRTNGNRFLLLRQSKRM